MLFRSDGETSSKHLEGLALRSRFNRLVLSVSSPAHHGDERLVLVTVCCVQIAGIRLHTRPVTKLSYCCEPVKSVIILYGHVKNSVAQRMDAPPTVCSSHKEILIVNTRMLLSIDVGIKNLAMCLFDPSSKRSEEHTSELPVTL